MKQALAASATPRHAGVLMRQCACGNHALGGECESCRHSARLPRKPWPGVGEATATRDASLVPPVITEVLSATGQPLSPMVRTLLEPRFGHDFSTVRVHVGAQAAASAHAVAARAFTVGQHVVFGRGQYQPATRSGLELIAHELAHTIQQRAAPAAGTPTRISAVHDSAEIEADHAAQAVMRGDTINLPNRTASMLMRQPDPVQEELKRLQQGPKGPSPLLPDQAEEDRFDDATSQARGGRGGNWGWASQETSHVYQECNPAAMDRERFLKFEARLPKRPQRTTPKDMKGPLGATFMDVHQTVVPRIATAAVVDGGKTVFKLKPTHAEMAPIQSAYTGAPGHDLEFQENDRAWVKEECRDALRDIHRKTGRSRFPVFWRVTAGAAQKIREGELEHCRDFKAAFGDTLVLYASVINNLAAAERTYSTEKAARDDAESSLRWIGVAPGDMLAKYSQLAAKTMQRDDLAWHAAVSKSIEPQDNGCRGFLEIFSAASLPGVGTHPPEEVVLGVKKATP
jgi:hypothetical protein